MPDLAERYWTAADVRALPDDGKRYECIDGELLVTAAPRRLHQHALQVLYDALRDFVRREHVGDLMWSPADIELEQGTTVQPDLFVSRPRHGVPRNFEWHDIAGLLLAVEILSPTTARYDRVVKRRFYQRAGVDEYWIVDLEARLVERWHPKDKSPEILTERLRWSPDGVATPLDVDLTAYFAALLDG